MWRNVGQGDAEQPRPEGDWIALRLQQPGPNRDAIGAWIEVKVGDRRIDRELTVGGGHAGGQLGWVHFGLGDHDAARVRIQWPDGETGPWMDVPRRRVRDDRARCDEGRALGPGGSTIVKIHTAA